MRAARTASWKTPLACTAAATAICCGQQPPATAPEPTLRFYVSGSGSDAGAGSPEAPFATLERARAAVRALKAAGPLPAGGVAVIVRGGVYERATPFELTAADAGSAAAPVLYRAAPGEEVRLSGGRTVPPQALVPVTDAAVLARLDPAAAGQVLQADLKALGITELGQFPTRYRGAPAVPELFWNDQRLTLARWPNQGWATIARIVDPGSVPRQGDATGRPGIFEYAGDRPQRWNPDAGVWLQGYWCFDWFEEVIRVKAIDLETRQITLAEPHLYSVKQGNPSPRRYCALNVLEELDQPGDYYIDRSAGRLYVWPPTTALGARVVLSTLNAPLLTLKDCSQVTVRGFIVEAGLGDGIAVSGGSAVRIQACEVRNLRQRGIAVSGGLGHTVEACDVYDTGSGGIHIEGGDRKTLTPAGHVASNNHIWGFARHQLTYANGIFLAGVGNRAAHNLIHDAPHQAIGIGGNDHVFEYNVVHDICTETDDCGAYYKGRNPSCRGNLVRFNFWHNIGSPMGHGNAAVYFDDGDGGDSVSGNVFFRCGEPGKGSFGTVFSHGGHDLLAENNVFIECRRALGSAPWNDKRWQEYIHAELWQRLLLKEVDITQPPYTTHYPALVGFMDPQPGQPRANRAVRNLFVMVGEVSSGNWQWTPTENLVTNEDPGFVDAAKGDFRLRPDAAVFAKLPGFQAPPFAEMGLVQNALRPRLPVAAWTYGPPKPAAPPTQRSVGAAVAAPRQGPIPVFKVLRANAPIVVDGSIAAPEWPLADAARTMLLAVDVNGTPTPQRQSRAWLTYDQQTLYVAVDNTVSPETRLSGNQWGQDDAVEISLRVSRTGAKTPIHVLRGYGNGRLEFGTTPNAADEPATMDPGDIVYRAQTPQPGRWLAEFAIPFRMLDLDPATAPKAAFNLTVRKAADDLWLVWQPTHGHSYDVGQAGIIELLP